MASKKQGAIFANGSTFDYSVIQGVETQQFLQDQAIAIKKLIIDSQRLYQKAENALEQSTERLLEAGRSLQAAKDALKQANGHGHWEKWIVDEFSQTFVEIGILSQAQSVSPATTQRKAQELMQLARTINAEPEHQELFKLSNVKPYLMARLTASSTPKKARAELVNQIQQAQTTGQPLPTAKVVRQTLAQYSPKKERSVPLAPAAPQPAAKAVEIVSVIPSPARTATIDLEVQRVKPRHLYLCDRHVLFSGSPSDPQWQASLPRSTDKGGRALFELLTDYSSTSEPVVIEVGGQIFAACENLELLAEIIEEWTTITGKKAIETPLRR